MGYWNVCITLYFSPVTVVGNALLFYLELFVTFIV